MKVLRECARTKYSIRFGSREAPNREAAARASRWPLRSMRSIAAHSIFVQEHQHGTVKTSA
jgi:hypothetical protein